MLLRIRYKTYDDVLISTQYYVIKVSDDRGNVVDEHVQIKLYPKLAKYEIVGYNRGILVEETIDGSLHDLKAKAKDMLVKLSPDNFKEKETRKK